MTLSVHSLTQSMNYTATGQAYCSRTVQHSQSGLCAAISHTTSRESRFDYVMIDIDEWWNEIMSMAQRPIERMIRLGDQIFSMCLLYNVSDVRIPNGIMLSKYSMDFWVFGPVPRDWESEGS